MNSRSTTLLFALLAAGSAFAQTPPGQGPDPRHPKQRSENGRVILGPNGLPVLFDVDGRPIPLGPDGRPVPLGADGRPVPLPGSAAAPPVASAPDSNAQAVDAQTSTIQSPSPPRPAVLPMERVEAPADTELDGIEPAPRADTTARIETSAGATEHGAELARPAPAQAQAPAPATPPPAEPRQSRLVPLLIVALLLVGFALWWRNRGLAQRAAQLAYQQHALRTRHSELHKEAEALRHLAVNDTLTGALNRQAFSQALRERTDVLSRTARPLALIVFDLDHFKQINDRLGHLAGDAALRLVAGIVRECLDSDDLFGRFGGDEFLIACSDQEPEHVRAIAERLRCLVALRAPAHTPALPGLTLSLGVAMAQGSPADYEPDALFHRADAALYEAKRRGRNAVVMADASMPEPPLPTPGRHL